MSFRSFGAEVDCSEDTLHEWRDKYPDFSESYKRGIALMSKYFERLGHAMMAGKVKGNPAVYIFTLKNKLQWQDKLEITGNQDKPLKLLYSLDEDPTNIKPRTRTGTDDQSGEEE